MATTAYNALNWFFDQYSDHPELQTLRNNFNPEDPEQLTQIYQTAIPLIEDEMWSGAMNEPVDESALENYQKLFQELEKIITLQGNDSRHKFIITIPVADRPQHLHSCLNSLLTLCQKFNYGGTVNERFKKVMAIVADDSREPDNISKNRLISEQFTQEGLETQYFGLNEQLHQLDKLSEDERNTLPPVLGANDPNAFYHKGASTMRNIAYLKLNELQQESDEQLLFYFIDSDQEFRVKVRSESGNSDIYAISFLHKLEQIFSTTEATIMTGKVVGDPPVSPAVMASNFLEDVISFLQQMGEQLPQHVCNFHHNEFQKVDDASYHDMADLFGFKTAVEPYHYNCNISGIHNHEACFKNFAKKLNRFFDGEHPTRKTYYEHENLLTNIKPARTIYTGNYIFKPSALDYFIPFAALKLRMAGPVLGRLIKAEIGEAFVSANLPMLHKRTVHESGQSEFRPGIDRTEKQIDLSGEFERQFFGDVMLFTIDTLTRIGYPQQVLSKEDVFKQVEKIEREMHGKYSEKRKQIIRKIAALNALFSDTSKWWSQDNDLQQARDNFVSFIHNMSHNFGDSAEGYRLITSEENRQSRLDGIVAAITHYANDRDNWHTALNNRQDNP